LLPDRRHIVPSMSVYHADAHDATLRGRCSASRTGSRAHDFALVAP